MERSRERTAPAALASPDALTAGDRILLPTAGRPDGRAAVIARSLAAARDATLLAVDVRTGTVETLSDGAATGVENGADGVPDRAVQAAGRGQGALADAAGRLGTDESDDDRSGGRALATGEPVDASGPAADGENWATAGGPDPVRTVLAAVARHGVDLVVLDDGGTDGGVRRSLARQVARRVDCDSLLVSENAPTPSIASILVPVAEGYHTAAAVDAAAAIARANDAWIELLHVLEEPTLAEKRSARERLQQLRTRIGADVDVQTWLRREPSVRESILEQTAHYDVTVLGGSDRGRLRTFLFGSLSRSIAAAGENTVIVARRGSDGLLTA